MSQQELLKKVIQTLDDAGIQYLVTGSVASSLQGEPRSTHDIDLVVAIERSDAKKLVKASHRLPFIWTKEVSWMQSTDRACSTSLM